MSRVLVIEDNSVVRRAMLRMLEEAGYDVLGAEDGEQGLAVFRSERPDLVITDLVMPVKDGMETIVEIRRERPETKIIAVSGGARVGNTDILKIAKDLGADDIIPKPFDADDFIDRVRRCLDAR